MKTSVKQCEKRKKGFSIVELLTVMAIITILMGLLLPSLNRVRRYARKVKQKAQFHSIEVALDLYRAEEDGYPDSDKLDEADQEYCGAMKLAEAMVGQDLLGFHMGSHFRADLEDGTGTSLYDLKSTPTFDPTDPQNSSARKGPYLQLENANAYRLKNIYGTDNTGPSFDGDSKYLFVLCDVYTRMKHGETGKKIGMPILYYKANTSGSKNPYYFEDTGKTNNVAIDDPDNIYDHTDNDELVHLGMPWNTVQHSMDSDGGLTMHGDPPETSTAYNFYNNIWNEKVSVPDGRPYRADSYILLSAGFDGEYGTPDDVFNFGN